MFFSYIKDLLKISQAVLLQKLISELSKPLFWETSDVYYWAGGLSSAMILTWILLEHAFLSADELGANMKNAVINLMYKKVGFTF